MDQCLGEGWFLGFYDFEKPFADIEGLASSADLSDLARRNGASPGTPYFVSPDGHADTRINRFWRDPGVRTLAVDSQRRYAFSLKVWLNSLYVVGMSWDQADAATLAWFKEWRMSAEAAESHVEACSFAADLAALNRFYSWASTTYKGVKNPVRARHVQAVREDDKLRLEASPTGVRRSDVKWLTPDAFRLWRDVGLRGFTAEGLPSAAWRGGTEDRDVAFVEGLFGTGLRCAEWASILTIEVPQSGGTALSRCRLAAACAKRGVGRPFWLPRPAIQAVRFYVEEGSRPGAVARAQNSGLYEDMSNVLVVERLLDRRAMLVRDRRGTPFRIAVDGMSPTIRRRLFKRTPVGLEPLSVWLNADGRPRTKSSWSKVFANANSRVIRALSTPEGGAPRLWARPHMLRHSFALRWYSIATFVSWQRSADLTAADQRDMRHQLGDVWFLLATLLGHRSAETTRSIYLEPFQALQIEQLIALMDADDRAALNRLVDVLASNEDRVLSGSL